MRQSIRQQLGLWRSLLIYYGIPNRGRRMEQFYRPFIRPGDLCFDIGAHVGNRMRAWLKLGAQVVALEPQPHLMNFLRHSYGNHKDVTLIQKAVGAEEGNVTMFVSRLTPTVTSLSRDWIKTVKQDQSFAKVEWDDQIAVNLITLDNLIAQFGVPVYCKIDVEGYEAEVLKGLSRPIPMLSFEFIPATIDIARTCITRLNQLGNYEYNWIKGEKQKFLAESWSESAEMIKVLDRLQSENQSGDIYARQKYAG